MKKNNYELNSIPQIITFNDPGLDPDDLHSYCLLAGLASRKEISLLGAVVNLAPVIERAQIADSALDLLGFDIEVAVGSDMQQGLPCFKPHYAHSEVEFRTAEEMLLDLYNRFSNITLVLNSGLEDAANFIRKYPDLVENHTKEVIIMGGVNPEKTGKYLTPDSANNNTFSWSSTSYLYARLQELKIPMVITNRDLAYKCNVPFSVYDKIADTGNPVGIELKNLQDKMLEDLWIKVQDTSTERSLPPRCNIKWFCDVFCEGEMPKENESVMNTVKNFNLYDSINALAAVPGLRKMFTKTEYNVDGCIHKVLGTDNPEKIGALLQELEIEGLRVNQL